MRAVVAYADIATAGPRVLLDLVHSKSLEDAGGAATTDDAPCTATTLELNTTAVTPLLTRSDGAIATTLTRTIKLADGESCMLCVVNTAVAEEDIVGVADDVVQHLQKVCVDKVVVVAAVNIPRPTLGKEVYVVVTPSTANADAAEAATTHALKHLPESAQIEDRMLTTLCHLLRVARVSTTCLLHPAKRAPLGGTLDICGRLGAAVSSLLGVDAGVKDWGVGWEFNTSHHHHHQNAVDNGDNMLYR